MYQARAGQGVLRVMDGSPYCRYYKKIIKIAPDKIRKHRGAGSPIVTAIGRPVEKLFVV